MESKILKEEKNIINRVNSSGDMINIMEVCGTHTAAISKFGLRQCLANRINFISGPGCPVCVTHQGYIDYMYKLSFEKDIIIATYGDMIRVPGSKPQINLAKAKSQGATIKIVYSSMDALKIAEDNPTKKVVFMGIGFETTAPATAIALKSAKEKNIKNFFVLSSHKVVEPVMRLLLEDKSLKVQGFLCPGHVAAIIGKKGFDFISEYECTAVVAGFELEELLKAIDMLNQNILNRNYKVQNAYNRLVKDDGNQIAMQVIDEVFEIRHDYWRGFGIIENSGLKIRKEYGDFDIENIYPLNLNNHVVTNGCKCGEILKGSLKPTQCPLFGGICTPDNPIGPCMVSNEGSCAAFYKYRIN